MSNKPVSDLERKKIKRLYNKGLSILNISYELNRNKNTIKKYVKEMGLVRENPDLIGQVVEENGYVSVAAEIQYPSENTT